MSGRGGDPAWVVWLSLVGLIAVIAGGVFAAVHFNWSGFVESAEEYEKYSHPETGKVGKTLQAKFPDEFAKLEKKLKELRDDGAEVSEIRAEFASFVSGARDRHVEEAAQAPHEWLTALRRADSDAIERLGEAAPESCALYVTNGGPQGGHLDKLAQSLEDDAHAAFWNAAAAGRDKPVDREVDVLSNDDAVAFDEALRKAGISETDLRLLNRLGNMPSEKQCEIGLQRLRAIDGMAPEAGDRVHANLILGYL